MNEVFIPPTGELLQSSRKEDLLRLQPVIVSVRGSVRTYCLILVNDQKPSETDAAYWSPRKIELPDGAENMLAQPTELFIEAVGQGRPYHFSWTEGAGYVMTRGNETERVLLDTRSSSIISYLILECHRQMMVTS